MNPIQVLSVFHENQVSYPVWGSINKNRQTKSLFNSLVEGEMIFPDTFYSMNYKEEIKGDPFPRIRI